MDNKLKTKDYITIGIFSAIYIVGFMIVVTIVGFMPMTYIFSSSINALILAPIYFLFIARTKKKRAVLIFGTIIGLFFGTMMTGYWLMIPTTIIGVLLAEYFVRRAEFKHFGTLVISYICFSLWSLGIFSSFFVFKDTFMAASAKYYDDSYLAVLENMLNQPILLVVIYIAMIVAAIIGAYMSKALLNKHFKKAGII